MRKTICTLMVLAATGCGGGDGGGSATAADRTAPTLTLSAPATSVSGGDTVVISVAAVDNVDPTVTYTLSCTGGGRLTGNSLVLPDVTAATAIQCTATGTDAAGNTGTGSLTLNVTPTTAKVTLATGSQAVNAGGSGLIFVDNLTLSQETYDGTIGGKAVKLSRVGGNELMFTTPLDLPAGTQRLQVSVGSRSYAFDLTVSGAIAVANPRSAILTLINNAKTSISSRLASPTISAADRGTLQDYSAKLDQTTTAIGSVSDADLAKLASFLAANGAISSGSASIRTAYEPIKGGEDCKPAFAAFAKPLMLAVGGAVWLKAAVSVTIAVGTAAPALVVPDIIFAGIGIAAGATLTIVKGGEAINAFADMRQKCWTEVSIDLLSFLDQQQAAREAITVKAISVAAKQAFGNKTSRTFRVSRNYAPQDAIKAEIARMFGDVTEKLLTTSFISDDLKAQLGGLKSDGAEFVPAANLSIGSISRGDISGQLEAVTAEAIKITFTYTGTTQPTQNIDFTFALNRTGEQAATVSAQLAVALPEADPASLQVIQDTLTGSMVQARNATSLEIVTRPANGTVTLNNNGIFNYTPNSRFFGTDSFTYRARNDQGVSKEATVSISVVRRFEGVWNISTVSQTSSESRPGLCPVERNTFTVNVSKVSDTQYTANYAGYDISLSMSSRDDPQGPKGSRTVTYDDDPGRTTETVTVQIPDSRRLFGTSFFDYAGPNNTSCKGTVDIVGTR